MKWLRVTRLMSVAVVALIIALLMGARATAQNAGNPTILDMLQSIRAAIGNL